MSDLQLNQAMLNGLKAIHNELQRQTLFLQQQEKLLDKLQKKVNQLYTMLALILVVIPIFCGILYMVLSAMAETSTY